MKIILNGIGYFTLQGSKDANTWDNVAKIHGSGNSLETKQYSVIIDDVSTLSYIYYRLQQVDYDGRSHNSKIIQPDQCTHHKDKIVLYPNPANQFVHISASDDTKENISSIFLKDWLGREKLHFDQSQDKLDISQLPNGTYTLTIIQKDNTMTTNKIVICRD